MRRTTSALTTVVLGAVLTASMVSARQLPAPDNAPQAKSSTAGPTAAPDSATAAASSQVYGTSPPRGARFLLRNGLDYLGYQEYDRSLKFLREAEVRQKELNDAERLALKQGIESAQRGLRNANDAQSPYALSDRSRPRNGFAPARPETRVAAITDQIKTPARRPKTNPPAPPGMLGNDADDQGEPIRLASAETPISDPPADANSGSRSANGDLTSAPARSGAEQPRNMPEIPQIPAVSQLPDLTEANGSDRPMMPAHPNVSGRVPGVAPMPAVPGRVVARVSEVPVRGQAPQVSKPDEMAAADLQPQADRQSAPAQPAGTPAGESNRLAEPESLSLAPSLDTAPDPLPRTQTRPSVPTAQPVEAAPAGLALPLSQPATVAGGGAVTTAPTSQSLEPTSDPTPAAGPVVEAAAGQDVQKQILLSPASPGDSPGTITLATTPASSPELMPVAKTSGLAGPADPNSASTASKNASVIDLETVPSSVTAGEPARAGDPSAPVHQEKVDTVAAAVPDSLQGGSPAQATTTPETLPVSAVADDELPPLPADLGRPAPAAGGSTAEPATATATAARPAVPVDEELPPLPANLGSSVSPSIMPPAQTVNTATPLPALPLTAAQEPTQPGATGSAHTEQETTAPVLAGSEVRPVPPAPDGESRQLDAGSAPAVAPAAPDTLGTSGPDRAVAPGSTANEMPRLAGLGASSAPTAPVSQAYPTTNPNLQPPPPATSGTGVETAPDVSSLPPAIRGGPLASSFDLSIPERATPPSTLRPDLMREVEKIARNQEDELHRQAQNPPQPGTPPRDAMASDLRTQTQLDISRAPSPAEARPIKAIPVPEDWVPLPPRNWTPQRKYWAAAATCHLPLYFQDPVLERYGHSVEQFVGPIGRYLSYPVDDPTQSTQRNQMLQPFFSAGLMSLQIIAWPYNLIMDPPWEAQYDLGYYRPGDNIPTDTYWLPLHGYGPPLRGSNY